jgi:rod shape-determining protein MreC
MHVRNTARRNTVLLAFLLAGQLLLMASSARRTGRAGRIEGWVTRVSAPGVTLAQLLSGGVGTVVDQTRELMAARARAAVLEQRLEGMAAELVAGREALDENRRLRWLLDMRQAFAVPSVAASVVMANVNGQTRMIVVDRGARDGLRPECPVVAWGGAVGRVVAVGPNHAKVRLLTDASSGVAAVVQRSRVQGMVLGRAADGMDLLYVPRFADVLHGDRVVTSGLDGIFPRGFGIGRVAAIADTPEGSQRIHLEPELDFHSLEEVLVLLEASAAGAVPDGTDGP